MIERIGFLLGLLAVFTNSYAVGETFRITTFNAEFMYKSKVHIKYGLKFDMKKNTSAQQAEWAPASFRQEKFDTAADIVGEAIAKIETDLLILTEVGNGDDLQALVDSIASHGVTYPHVEVCDCNDPTGQNVAILSKRPFKNDLTLRSIPGRAAFLIEEDDPDEFNDTGITKGMRVVVEIENGDGDMEDVYIYGVHFVSERKGHDTDQQRIAQATLVRRHIVPLLNEGEHVIVAGDLNDRRGEPAIMRVRGFDDIWPELLQTGHHVFFPDDLEHTRWTHEFRGVRNQIDHILVSYSLRRTRAGTVNLTI